MREHAFVSAGEAVIVTGAAGGIGIATVMTLVEQGIHVFCVDKNETALKQVVPRVNRNSELITAIVADVTSEQDCMAVCETAKKTGLTIKGLVNNAAVGAFNSTVESTSLTEWERILRVNLTSLFLMSKYALPLIRAGGGGAIVNVSSIHAFATSPGVSPYAAAKGGVLTLTKTMALDLATDRIRVVCVIPGATDTPMLQQHAERENKSLQELGFPPGDSAIGRIAKPEEIADVISFALSRGASFITGSSIIADGGILSKF